MKNKAHKSVLDHRCESQVSETANTLQQKLRFMRQQRTIKEQEQQRKKDWDNLDDAVIKKFNDLESHKDFIHKTSQNIIQNNKIVLFKQKYEILQKTKDMENKANIIIEKEKDKLIEVFDQQLYCSRRAITPEHSFYTNIRLKRSHSMEMSYPNKQNLLNCDIQTKLSNWQKKENSIFRKNNKQSQTQDHNSLNFCILGENNQLKQIQNSHLILSKTQNLNRNSTSFFPQDNRQAPNHTDFQTNLRNLSDYDNNEFRIFSIGEFHSNSPIEQVKQSLIVGENPNISDDNIGTLGSQATHNATTFSLSDNCSQLNFTNDNFSSCGRIHNNIFEERKQSNETLRNILSSSATSVCSKQFENNKFNENHFKSSQNDSILKKRSIENTNNCLKYSQVSISQPILLQRQDNQYVQNVHLKYLTFQKLSFLVRQNNKGGEIIEDIQSSNVKIQRGQNGNFVTPNIQRRKYQKMKLESSNRKNFGKYYQSLRLKIIINRLAKKQQDLKKQKLKFKQQEILFEKQFDSLFETIRENEKEVKSLQRQERVTSRQFLDLSRRNEETNKSFIEFKKKLEDILIGYSNDLSKFNQNETNFIFLQNENEKLKQERNKLICFLNQFNDYQK